MLSRTELIISKEERQGTRRLKEVQVNFKKKTRYIIQDTESMTEALIS